MHVQHHNNRPGADPTSSSSGSAIAQGVGVGGHGLGLSRLPRGYYSNDNTPFMDFDDDDDQYGVYLPSGKLSLLNSRHTKQHQRRRG